MSLQNRTCMEELFALLGKASAVIYDDDELNEAVNYALALENDEQQILSIGKYTLTDILYARYYWFTKFLFAMKPIMEKMQVWNNNNLRLLRLWIMRSVFIPSMSWLTS
jgi:hypothetical protein